MNDISTSFKSLSHPIRVEILLILDEKLNSGYNFSEISRQLDIESTSKLSFHMDKLDEFVEKDDNDLYYLNQKGKKAIDAIKLLGVQGRDPTEISRQMNQSVGDSMQQPEAPKISRVDDQNQSDLFPYKYGMVMGGSLLYNVFTALGIPLLFVLTLTALGGYRGDGTLIGFTLLSGLFSLSTGAILYFLANREGSEAIWQDIGIFTLVLSSTTGVATASFMGAGIAMFILPATYLLITAGFYLTATIKENTDATQWLIPQAISQGKTIKTTLLVLIVLCIPFLQKEVTIDQSTVTGPTGQQNVGYSAAQVVSSSAIGTAGLMGFMIIVLFLGLTLIVPALRSIKSRYIYIGIAILSILQLIQVVGDLLSGDFIRAMEINFWNGLFLAVTEIAVGIAYVAGLVVSGRIFQNQFEIA